MYVCVSYKMYDVNAGRYIYKRTSLQGQDSVTTDVMVTDLFSISFFSPQPIVVASSFNAISEDGLE